MSTKGIDVSKWQGDIDWQKVKNSGIDFAIIREGYGRKDPNQVDKKFLQNYENAKNAGIHLGCYHYSYADSVDDAKREAEFCIENINGKQFEYPICFDIEDKEQLKLTTRQRTDIIKTFCEELENAGYYAMLYCNLNWLNNYLYSEELIPRFDLWLAQWGIDSPSVSCGIWQYTSSGAVDGINGNVDMDIANKDYPTLMRIIGCNGFNSTSGGEYKGEPEQQNNYSNVPEVYKVQKGDTLSGICNRYGLNMYDVAKLNNISNVNVIYAGELLKLKCPGNSNSSDSIYSPPTVRQFQLETNHSSSAASSPFFTT